MSSSDVWIFLKLWVRLSVSVPSIAAGIVTIWIFQYDLTFWPNVILSLIVSAILTFIIMWIYQGRLLTAKYYQILYIFKSPLENTARNSRNFFITLREKLKKPADRKIASYIRGLYTLLAMSLLLIVSFTNLTSMEELRRIEFAAVWGTGLTVVITHARLRAPSKEAMKILGIILCLIGLAISGAAAFLLWPKFPWSFEMEFEARHAMALLIIGWLQFAYDLVAWLGSEKAGEGEKEKHEHLQMCWQVDLPVAISCSVILLYWWLQKDQMGRDVSEGIVAGAILMQWAVSTLLFIIVKESLLSRANPPETTNAKRVKAATNTGQ